MPAAKKTTKPPAKTAIRSKTAMNGTAKTSGTMGDKEIFTDMLSGQKFLTSAYNNYAGECQCDEIRGALLNILKEEHDIQNELFTDMNARGWYKVKPAPAREVTTALNKYQG